MDIHAKIYVPHALKAVNDVPCPTISSQAHEPIDYEQYIAEFSGRLYLHPHPPALPLMQDNTTSHDSSQLLSPSTYHSTFQKGLLEEYSATVESKALFDKFNVQLSLYDSVNALYLVRVPGLLENAPQIDVGDIVYLRQLVIDPITGLPAKTLVRTPTGEFRENYAPGFTGVQLEALAWGFIRAEEKMILRIDGVSPHGSNYFNISFPVQERHVMALQRALNTTAYLLGYPMHPANSNEPKSAWLPYPLISKQHESQSVWIRNMLFPSEEYSQTTLNYPKGTFKQGWIDTMLNYEQKKAIDSIQTQGYGTLPFLLSGIPGSGKTKAVVEAVLQMHHTSARPGSILVTAPSDNAADMLALRLSKHFKPTELFRLNHHSRTFQSVRSELLPYCYTVEDTFSMPPFPQLMAYSVVVTTCKDADILVQARVTNNDLATWQHRLNQTIGFKMRDPTNDAVSLHWSALFVDEAAQATEVETLIPLSVVAPPTTLQAEQEPIFVLIGDPNQLGPKLYSRNKELSTSLIERLFRLPLYAHHPLARHSGQADRKVIFPMIVPPFVNFSRNYRSHEAVLAVPSSLFYNNTLIPESTDSKRSIEGWPGWKGRGWPVLFVCNYGLDTCQDVDTSSEGWYNQREAHMATNLARDMLQSGRVQERDVCIMAPFAAQVRLIRSLCRARGMHRCNVGPDFAFQGLEFKVVIVCTTRTRSRFLAEDRRKGMGIIGEEKKLNVAVTRAEDGLVVIGNPWTLAQDRCWNALMTFCWRNGLRVDNGNPSDEVDNGGSERHWKPAKDDDAFQVQGLEAAMVYREDVVQEGLDAVEGAMAGISLKGKISLRTYSDQDPMIASGIAAEEFVKAQEGQ